jgi:hypothetical protein
MAEFRERPYGQFNFLVDLGTGDTTSAQAGFQEVSGLGMEITVAEYRNGNEKDNAPRKLRAGSQSSLRTVTIQLQNEDHTSVVMEWKLTNARPTKYTGPSFNGKGTDVAIEELVLACERIDLA